MSGFRITEQPNVFDDYLLEIIGREFKFDHAKGFGEWIKNSVDAYNRETNDDGTPQYADDDQFIYLRLRPKTSLSPVVFECIDFVGMTHEEIDKAFKRWGDPNAASRGKGRRFLGGHGNGGKFYMRQMFTESRFITYRKGKLNVFGFNERKRYGFDPSYENRSMGLKRALELANLNDMLRHVPEIVRRRLESGKAGFTVVVGEAPHRIKRKNSPRSILQRLCIHAQARRLIKHKPIFAIVADQAPFRLQTETIAPRPGFEGPFSYDVPTIIQVRGAEVQLANEKFSPGKLSLMTSAEPFSRLGDRASLNCIDILGGVGVVASYRMNELGQIKNFSETEFIYGECECPILEDPENDCVRNSRDKLVEDDEKVQALLGWICQKVNDLADKMAAQSEAEQRTEQLKQSSVFNEFLNSWMRKTKFWEKLRGVIFGGPGSGPGFNGTGGGGDPSAKTKKSGGDKGTTGPDGNTGGGSGDQKKSGPKFPAVLLSNYDTDPLGYSTSVNCESGHPPVYQRDVDVPESIFWINTQSPFAKQIRESKDYGPESTRWREYIFQRHVDILVKQAIYETEKQESGLSAARVDALLDKIYRQIYEAATKDPSLQSFLFHERLSSSQEPTESTPSEEPTELQPGAPAV